MREFSVCQRSWAAPFLGESSFTLVKRSPTKEDSASRWRRNISGVSKWPHVGEKSSCLILKIFLFAAVAEEVNRVMPREYPETPLPCNYCGLLVTPSHMRRHIQRHHVEGMSSRNLYQSSSNLGASGRHDPISSSSALMLRQRASPSPDILRRRESFREEPVIVDRRTCLLYTSPSPRD